MRPDWSIHWSAYPSLLLAGVFGGGIVLDQALGAVSTDGWLVGVMGGAILFVAAQWRARRRMVTLGALGRVAAVGLVVLCAGAAPGTRRTMPRRPVPRRQ